MFPLLFASIWIFPLSWFCVRPLSHEIFLISISVSACDAALISMKRWARASCAGWAFSLPLPLRQNFSPALLYEGSGSPVRLAIRYRRWLTFLLLPLPWGLASAIFFLSKKRPFSFATLRLLILHEESRLAPFPELQKPGIFFPTCFSMLLPAGSEIFLVWGTAKPQFARIHRAGFFLRQRLGRGGDFQGLRQRRAQLRAKCESAPLRRSVTERTTRSTPNAFVVN